MPYLELRKKNSDRVARLDLDGDPVTIGRSSSNRLVLSDIGVSRRHCVIEMTGDRARIRDLGSRHGLRLNGTKVPAGDLAHGDRIRIGPFEIKFVSAPARRDPNVEIEAGKGAPPSRPVTSAVVAEPKPTESRGAELRQRAAKAEADLAETRSKLEQAQANIEATQERLGKAEAQVAELEAQLAEAHRAAQATAAEADRWRRGHEQLEGHVAELDQQRAALSEKSEDLAHRLDEVHESQVRAEASRQGLSRRVREETELRTTALNQLKAMQARLAGARQELVALRSRFTECRSLLSQYQEILWANEILEVEEVDLVEGDESGEG
ncbi:MAG: FHA domain-containing protein [Planctomycetota bacterium]|jgi:pSer/pThr/pTyr-binding forkhead associated (FHA) protein